MRDRIDAHFQGRIKAADEAAMRQHLVACRTCRAYYERHLLLAKMDPESLTSRERLARGLGLRRQPSRLWAPAQRLSKRYRIGAGLIATCGCASIALFLALNPLSPSSSTTTPPPSEFQARGGAAAHNTQGAKLYVYRILEDSTKTHTPAQRLRPGDTIFSSDSLAFAYDNPNDKQYLMIFGRTPENTIYWYHPEWSDPNTAPHAIRIQPSVRHTTATGGNGMTPIELPVAITHALSAKKITLLALFSDRLRTTQAVEDHLRFAPGDEVIKLVLKVSRPDHRQPESTP